MWKSKSVVVRFSKNKHKKKKKRKGFQSTTNYVEMTSTVEKLKKLQSDAQVFICFSTKIKFFFLATSHSTIAKNAFVCFKQRCFVDPMVFLPPFPLLFLLWRCSRAVFVASSRLARLWASLMPVRRRICSFPTLVSNISPNSNICIEKPKISSCTLQNLRNNEDSL